MTIDLKSYDLDVAEAVIIMRCINEHSKLSITATARLLGISKSKLYRKLNQYNSDHFRSKLINLGYTLTETRIITIHDIK